MRRTLIALLLTLAACGGGTPEAPSLAAWESLPPPPLTPRSQPAVAWTGNELLVVGGDVSAPCPPGASCVGPQRFARDGAAYDPDRRSWRAVAPAPRDIGGYSLFADGVLWCMTGFRGDDPLLAYDVAKDTWTQHAAPPGGKDDGWTLAAQDGLLMALRNEQQGRPPDALYDSRTRRWSDLPRDPLYPSSFRSGLSTPRGLLVGGPADVPQPGRTPTFWRGELLDVRTRTWTAVPDGDLLAGGAALHGDRVLFLGLGGENGGQVNGYGRTVPYGGVLDLATGTWEPLEGAPAPLTGGWGVGARGSAVNAVQGWLYDDRDRTWTKVPRPEGAPERPGVGVIAEDTLWVVGGASPGKDRAPVQAQGLWALDLP